MMGCWKVFSLTLFPKSESHYIWKETSFICKVPLCRILVLIFLICSRSLTEPCQWKVEFSSVELWVIMKFLFLQKKSSKRNPWVGDANIGWHVPFLLKCEGVVYQLPAWRFWDTKMYNSLERSSTVSTPDIFMT